MFVNESTVLDLPILQVSADLSANKVLASEISSNFDANEVLASEINSTPSTAYSLPSGLPVFTQFYLDAERAPITGLNED